MRQHQHMPHLTPVAVFALPSLLVCAANDSCTCTKGDDTPAIADASLADAAVLCDAGSGRVRRQHGEEKSLRCVGGVARLFSHFSSVGVPSSCLHRQHHGRRGGAEQHVYFLAISAAKVQKSGEIKSRVLCAAVACATAACGCTVCCVLQCAVCCLLCVVSGVLCLVFCVLLASLFQLH